MRAAGTSRLVAISAAPVATDDHDTTLPYRLLAAPLLRRVLRRGHADMASMQETIRRSGADWTILRPPRLTNGPRTGTYRQASNTNLRRGYRLGLPSALTRRLADAASRTFEHVCSSSGNSVFLRELCVLDQAIISSRGVLRLAPEMIERTL